MNRALQFLPIVMRLDSTRGRTVCTKPYLLKPWKYSNKRISFAFGKMKSTIHIFINYKEHLTKNSKNHMHFMRCTRDTIPRQHLSFIIQFSHMSTVQVVTINSVHMLSSLTSAGLNLDNYYIQYSKCNLVLKTNLFCLCWHKSNLKTLYSDNVETFYFAIYLKTTYTHAFSRTLVVAHDRYTLIIPNAQNMLWSYAKRIELWHYNYTIRKQFVNMAEQYKYHTNMHKIMHMYASLYRYRI